MFFHKFGCDAYDVLTLPVLHHVERLQCTDNVILGDACHLTKNTKNSILRQVQMKPRANSIFLK